MMARNDMATPPHIIAKIRRMRKAGASIPTIAMNVGRGKTTVHKYCVGYGPDVPVRVPMKKGSVLIMKGPYAGKSGKIIGQTSQHYADMPTYIHIDLGYAKEWVIDKWCEVAG